jgi:single-strand DNA-binding protein
MNNITIAGQLGRDAEVRYLPNGDPVANFSVADSQGKDKTTIWWNCQFFGKRAESLSQYLTKGQSVTVSGNITQRTYQKDGVDKTAMEIRVSDVALQGGRKDEAQPRQSAPARQAPSRQAPAPRPATDFSDMDSDIPW